MSGYDLSYVALSSREPGQLIGVLGNDLGMAGEAIDAPGGDVHLFGAGKSGLCVFNSDHPLLDNPGGTGLDHIALSSADPAAAAKAHGLRVIGEEKGVGAMAQVRIAPEQTVGVRTRFAEPLVLPKSREGLVERIDHLGVASADVGQDEAVFVTNLGCPVESRQTDFEVSMAVESFTSDKYGVIYHNRQPEPVGGLRVLFVTIGDFELEFLQDIDPTAAHVVDHGHPGNTKQDRGVIGSYVAKRGAGLHHIALKTPDINKTLAHLDSKGRRMIDLEGRPGSRRAKIGFIHPSALGGVLLHFVERTEI
ncbi:MAG: VOC family protein [Proteobacteria bacterium]|nr:VOC family protein [Pseudomonadota bacterium]